jgi:hypothetical protein
MKAGEWRKEHEAGHTLNLPAFGSVFHLAGLDENATPRGANAFSERLAESNATWERSSNLPMRTEIAFRRRFQILAEEADAGRNREAYCAASIEPAVDEGPLVNGCRLCWGSFHSPQTYAYYQAKIFRA